MPEIYRLNLISPDGKTLDPNATQRTINRLFDLVNFINPPTGSNYASPIINAQFVQAFSEELGVKTVLLQDVTFSATTSELNWNNHSLIYNGTTYSIEGGTTTNGFVYWDVSLPTAYQTATTYPTLSPDLFLIVTFDLSSGVAYEVWNNQLGPNTIGPTSISSLSVAKLTSGTIPTGVAMTLSLSDTVATKLIFGATASLFGETTNSVVSFKTLTTEVGRLNFGELDVGNKWAQVNFLSNRINLDAQDSTPDYVGIQLLDSTVKFFFTASGATRSDSHSLTKTLFEPYDTNTTDLGSSSKLWKNGFFAGALEVGQLNFTGATEYLSFTSGSQIALTVNSVGRLKVDTTNSSTATALYVYYNGSLVQVTVGAVDSGGAGYKLLRVLN